jgi:ketosteroid isomerase-like protein
MSREHVELVRRENLETVRQAYADLNRGDIEAALDAFHDDAEHDWSRSIGPYSGVYVGRKQARRFWTSALDAVEELSFEIEDTLVEGPHVILMISARIRGRGSGAEAVGRTPHVWTLRDGQGTRFQLFQTWEEALEAVGLRE